MTIRGGSRMEPDAAPIASSATDAAAVAASTRLAATGKLSNRRPRRAGRSRWNRLDDTSSKPIPARNPRSTVGRPAGLTIQITARIRPTTSATSSKAAPRRCDGSTRDRSKVEVLRDSRAVGAKRLREQTDSPLAFGQIVVIEIDVEQVDVPGQLDVVHDVGLDNRPGDGQRGVLRDVVDIPVARSAQLLVLLDEKPREQLFREEVARLDAHLVVFGQPGVLVKPFPQDAETDFACGHVFHQIQHVVVSEKVCRLQRGRLESLSERIAVLKR